MEFGDIELHLIAFYKELIGFELQVIDKSIVDVEHHWALRGANTDLRSSSVVVDEVGLANYTNAGQEHRLIYHVELESNLALVDLWSWWDREGTVEREVWVSQSLQRKPDWASDSGVRKRRYTIMSIEISKTAFE